MRNEQYNLITEIPISEVLAKWGLMCQIVALIKPSEMMGLRGFFFFFFLTVVNFKARWENEPG